MKIATTVDSITSIPKINTLADLLTLVKSKPVGKVTVFDTDVIFTIS